MSNPWFESVAEAQRRAKKRLPKSVYRRCSPAPSAGRSSTTTSAAFARARLRAARRRRCPPSATWPRRVMGQAISLPVIISPTGVQAVHPDGEVAVARAAAARGTAMGLSSFASKPVEEVVAANPQTFFQIYWAASREQIVARHRARTRRRRGGPDRHPRLVVLHGRDWGSPTIPEQIDLKSDGAASRRRRSSGPRGSSALARAGRLPDLTAPNLPAAASRPDVLRRLRRVDADPAALAGTTSPGCASSGTARSCSRA